MLKAPVLVCILIAGADGEIDRKEIREAIAIVSQSKESYSVLSPYFKEISLDFEDKLKVIIQDYPADPALRAVHIEEELSQLNTLWPRLDRLFAGKFYSMLLELAAKVAASSGGLLGMNAITDEEARYLQLSMIQNPSG